MARGSGFTMKIVPGYAIRKKKRGDAWFIDIISIRGEIGTVCSIDWGLDIEPPAYVLQAVGDAWEKAREEGKNIGEAKTKEHIRAALGINE